MRTENSQLHMISYVDNFWIQPCIPDKYNIVYILGTFTPGELAPLTINTPSTVSYTVHSTDTEVKDLTTV